VFPPESPPLPSSLPPSPTPPLRRSTHALRPGGTWLRPIEIFIPARLPSQFMPRTSEMHSYRRSAAAPFSIFLLLLLLHLLWLPPSSPSLAPLSALAVGAPLASSRPCSSSFPHSPPPLSLSPLRSRRFSSTSRRPEARSFTRGIILESTYTFSLSLCVCVCVRISRECYVRRSCLIRRRGVTIAVVIDFTSSFFLFPFFLFFLVIFSRFMFVWHAPDE